MVICVFGYKVIDVVFVVFIIGELVLNGWVFYFGVFFDDDFYDCCV